VITTVNIQHLESIADAVEQMTGTAVGNAYLIGLST
jgi:K+-sensing histidine kinase KdpD